MLTPACPNCEWLHPRLINLSAHSPVKYYRCGSCGHTWTATTEGSEPANGVTSHRPARALLPPEVKRRA